MQYQHNLLLTNLDDILQLGSVRPLDVHDIHPLPNELNVSKSYEIFQKHWHEELHTIPPEKRSLWRSLFKTTGYKSQIIAICLSGISAGCLIGPPLILRSLSNHFSDVVTLPTYELWILVTSLLILPIIGGICSAHSFVIFSNSAIVVRSALIPALYRKSLVLSNQAKEEFSTGQIVNLFSTDLTNIQLFIQLFSDSLFAPAQLAVALGLVYREVGTAMFAGFGAVLLLLPFLLVLFVFFDITKRQKSIIGDSRIALMNEILSGIRILKYYAWEIPFSSKVEDIRQSELKTLFKLNTLMIAIVTCVVSVPYVLPIIIFYTYAKVSENELNTTIAFTTLALLGLVTTPLSAIPGFLQRFFAARVSIVRICNFLQAEELKNYLTHDVNKGATVTIGLNNNLIEIEDVSAGWDVESKSPSPWSSQQASARKPYELVSQDGDKTPTPTTVAGNEESSCTGDSDIEMRTMVSSKSTLSENRSIITLVDISLEVKRGELVAIVGNVGSGKSSMLSLLLGDVNLTSGRVAIASETSIAYHSQQPWILNSTVRNNITCGLPLDQKRLEVAIEAACLTPDLLILPAGLDTEIGEKGINLSGGQRARISFARAVYRQADLYLLDDPLSAVDAHVGDHLFHKGICETLKEKTVILVTHQVHLLDECDRIVVLRDGRIFIQGSPIEIAAAGINFKEVLVDEDELFEVNMEAPDPEMTIAIRNRAISSEQPELKETEPILVLTQELTEESGKFMTVEEKSGGKVANEVYLWYFQMGGYALLLMAIVVSLGGVGSYSYSSFYLSHWGKVASENAMSGHPLSTTENVNYVSRYGLLSSMAIISSTIRSLIFVVIGIKASKQMHRLLLRGVVSSPIAHFDTTPMGRIINRFTADLTLVDETLTTTMAFLLAMISTIFGVIGTIAYTTKGMILTLLGPLLILYYFIQLYFRRTNTELKRLENITRSPIYSEFNLILAGVKSLRSYQLQDFFIHRMEGYVDTNSGIWLIQQLIKWWLTLRLETMGGMISFFIAALAAGESLFIEKQYVSLSLQAAFSLMSTVKYLVLKGSEVEAIMNSVERIKHYSESIAPEETSTIISRYLPKEGEGEAAHGKGGTVDKENKEKSKGEEREEREGEEDEEDDAFQSQELQFQEIPTTWPEHGAISFKNVSMSYHGGPLVLKRVSFDILPCEKIGIAGRTGCGKSSLMVALYRFENLQGGSIEIDGIDISRVPLETLRSRIGIIPQEPVIFSVTIRFNLDPFDSFSDEELWSVLECVQMKETILSLPNGLLEAVSEGGENFSIGQRQLLCIARLLLRKPKVLVMDESTSSIDNETDAWIQKMIRNKFDECTVLTIAHRLHTVIDSDRILVMDRGRVCQFENPKELTQGDGLFSDLWARHVSSHSSKRLGKV